MILADVDVLRVVAVGVSLQLACALGALRVRLGRKAAARRWLARGDVAGG